MFKLWSGIKKEARILLRDRIGLLLLFAMPILLVIVIASVQNSTFELVNDNKIKLLIYNKDTGLASRQFIHAVDRMGLYQISFITGPVGESDLSDKMHNKDALIGIVIPGKFSEQVAGKAASIAKQALQDISVAGDTAADLPAAVEALTMYYHPVLQESFRRSVEGSLSSALQIVQSKAIVKDLYQAIHEKNISDSLENDIVNNQIPIHAVAAARDGSRNIPNATQHNVPAWTIFAMFFIVISLAGNIVREKTSGSFVRLKTMPTNYVLALLAKQITYLVLTIVQAAVIFAIGLYIFPHLGLPRLDLPADIPALVLVTLVCGWCATAYAIMVGVFANTQEQANGFGAVSVVLLAAIGGLLVPSFVMPSSMQSLMKLSPLHWCLEAYYGLFLEGGKLKDIFSNILSLLGITLVIQFLTIVGLKRKNLI